MMSYVMGIFSYAYDQNTPNSIKFLSDTVTMVLEQAASEMTQFAIKMQSL